MMARARLFLILLLVGLVPGAHAAGSPVSAAVTRVDEKRCKISVKNGDVSTDYSTVVEIAREGNPAMRLGAYRLTVDRAASAQQVIECRRKEKFMVKSVNAYPLVRK